MPSSSRIYWYFEHTGLSQERQTNLLLRTNGEYNWRKLKQAIDVLYPNTLVSKGYTPSRSQGKGRGAHEVHAESTESSWPSWDASEEQLEDWLWENDPIETLANADLQPGVPEEVSRELHQCFATRRENRQKLAKAVKARGFYVSGGNAGKGKKGGKGSKGGKSKSKRSKGGGKARGMSLQELKAVTTCGDCEQIGHWKATLNARSNAAELMRRHATLAMPFGTLGTMRKKVMSSSGTTPTGRSSTTARPGLQIWPRLRGHHFRPCASMGGRDTHPDR